MRKDEMRLRLNSKSETGAQHGEAGIIISVEKWVAESQYPDIATSGSPMQMAYRCSSETEPERAKDIIILLADIAALAVAMPILRE